MAVLTVQNPALAGTVEVMSPASGGGDSFPNTGKEFLRVLNGSLSSKTVTADSPNPCNFGVTNAAHDKAVAVAAGEAALIGPFPPGRFNDTNARVQLTYSGVGSLEVAVIAME